MSRPSNIRHQLPVIATLAKTASRAALRLLPSTTRNPPASSTQALHVRRVSSLPRSLIDDYLGWCGVDTDRYSGTVPAHLFPQWSVPTLGEAIAALPYPVLRVLNAGCRMEIHRPIPAGEPLIVEAKIAKIEDDGRRALIRQSCTTSDQSGVRFLTAEVRAVVPLSRREKGPRKERPTAPDKAEIIERLGLGACAGLDYAFLTGDFNPIHWLGPYARASGFQSTILHGFATMALSFEALATAKAGGDPWAIASIDLRFTRPLTLPREIGLYLSEGSFWMADAPGEPAYLTGTFELR